jgi:hypothetical protein
MPNAALTLCVSRLPAGPLYAAKILRNCSWCVVALQQLSHCDSATTERERLPWVGVVDSRATLALLTWAVNYLVRQSHVKQASTTHALDGLTIHESYTESWFHFDELL